MSLWKRLKNLWQLSEFSPSSPEKERSAGIGDKFSMLHQPREAENPRPMATIIKRRPDPVEEALKETDE